MTGAKRDSDRGARRPVPGRTGAGARTREPTERGAVAAALPIALAARGGAPASAVLAAAIAASTALAGAAATEEGEVVFRAVCGDLRGYRVDMAPADPAVRERWREERYRAGPPPEGQGRLELLADTGHADSIRVTWGGAGRYLPVVYRDAGQVSVAEVDAFGVWIYTLFLRAEKILVSRQTTGPAPIAVGALVQGRCALREE